ncbi:peptide-methionine (R)-S-oxide reductase [Sinorhizobium meliloti]|nr:peptide-methionine (R)-S-oxide reductase [Sinorhizobium meliloti]
MPMRRVAVEAFEITRTDAEWRRCSARTAIAFCGRRAPEPPFSSPLDDESETASFTARMRVAGLFPPNAKYDSGTGWPSFWQALPGAIGTTRGRYRFMTRTECHCRRCGAISATLRRRSAADGKRHCINGLSLSFVPKLPERGDLPAAPARRSLCDEGRIASSNRSECPRCGDGVCASERAA